MSVVHERQSRQLCAIHAVNNLLQLHSSPDADTADEGCSASTDDTYPTHQSCMYQCGPFTVQRSCQVATKVEMDRIADDLALMERNLLLEDRLDSTKDGDYNSAGGAETPVDVVVEGSSSDSPHKELSMMDKLASNHRTVYLGCYSFECLELCLKRRGVTLEWYRVSDDSEQDSAAVLQQSVGIDQVVCGFIINLPDESPTFWSTFRHVPVLGRLVHVGRHWFSITRLRRRINNNMSEQAASVSTDTKEGWLLIDSDREDIVALSDIELIEYLASIHARGGQTFRATICTIEK